MSQQNEQNNSLDPATAPAKRKRGRPRKEDTPRSDPGARTQRQRRNSTYTPGEILGKPVSGVVDGEFESGLLISVRVGNSGPLLRGVVLDPRFAVPVTPANDVAPQIKMARRHESVSGPGSVANEVASNDGRQGPAARTTVSQEVTPMANRVSDCKTERLTGDLKLEPAMPKPVVHELTEQKPVTAIPKPTANQTGLNMDSKMHNSPLAEIGFEKKPDAAVLENQGNGRINEVKPVITQDELKPKPAAEVKPDPVGAVPEMKVELPGPVNPSAVPEPDPKGPVTDSPTEETKSNVIGDGNNGAA